MLSPAFFLLQIIFSDHFFISDFSVKAGPEVVQTCIVPENYPEIPDEDKHPS